MNLGELRRTALFQTNNDEEELEEEYKKIASGYNVDLEKVKESIPVSGITEDVVMRKAVELIKANAVKPAKKEAKKDTTKG